MNLLVLWQNVKFMMQSCSHVCMPSSICGNSPQYKLLLSYTTETSMDLTVTNSKVFSGYFALFVCARFGVFDDNNVLHGTCKLVRGSPPQFFCKGPGEPGKEATVLQC